MLADSTDVPAIHEDTRALDLVPRLLEIRVKAALGSLVGFPLSQQFIGEDFADTDLTVRPDGNRQLLAVMLDLAERLQECCPASLVPIYAWRCARQSA